METVRQYLKIDKWLIVGSSWGTTLALLYAEKYPQHVAGMVLRGIFLAREQDIGVTMCDYSQASMMHAKAWINFKTETSELLKAAKLAKAPTYPETYYQLLTHSTTNAQKLLAAAILIRWSNHCLALQPIVHERDHPLTIDDVNKLILELSYDVNKCYLSENQILQNIDVISTASIPIHIIQGTQDLICPPTQADALQQALPDLITRVNVRAGHVSEPVTEEAMVNATDRMAQRLRHQKKPSLARPGKQSL
jgi:proline iminopeptidase